MSKSKAKKRKPADVSEFKFATPEDVKEAQSQFEEDAYFVEVDDNGCHHCGGGRTWTVVCPDGYALGISYSEEDDASEMAELLNTAYNQGRNL